MHPHADELLQQGSQPVQHQYVRAPMPLLLYDLANASTFWCSVNPLYYVTFTTFTLIASFILFRGFNTNDPVNTISLLCGFLTIFTGVYLLNLSREDPDGVSTGIHRHRRISNSSDDIDEGRGKYFEVDGIPTDGLGAIQTRLSIQARRSMEDEGRHRRSSSWSLRSPITGSFPLSTTTASKQGSQNQRPSEQQHHLMHSYDAETQGLSDLAEDSDEDSAGGGQRRSPRTGGLMPNGREKQKDNGSSGSDASR